MPGAGWIAFDPTNRAVGSGNLIPVAVGRHIRQVAPVTGSFHGTNTDLLEMNVQVTVTESLFTVGLPMNLVFAVRSVAHPVV